MAATTTILDLVSVDYLTNCCVDWSDFFGGSLGVINLHHIPLLPKPFLPYTHRQRPDRGHMPRLALPLFYAMIMKIRPTNVKILKGFSIPFQIHENKTILPIVKSK
jgi:hypothetical protein